MNPFIGNLDFIFLFYGAAFFFLGTASLVLFVRERRLKTVPWIWLGLFGFTHGANEWLDMLANSLLDVRFFEVGRLFILVLSFLCLLEFSRRSTTILKKIRIGPWIYLPLIGLVLYDFYVSKCLGCTTSAIRYYLGFPAAVWTGFAFFGFRNNGEQRSPSHFLYGVIGFLFMLYAVAENLVVPKSHFWLSLFLNQSSFLEWTHVPLKLFRGLLVTLIAVFLIYRVNKVTLSMPGIGRGKRYVRYILTVFLSLYLIFLFAGFRLVNSVELYERHHQNRMILADARLLEQSIGIVDLGPFEGMRGDTVYREYRLMHNRMMQLADIAHFTKSLYLILFREGRPLFVVGSQSQVFPMKISPAFGASIPRRSIFEAAYSKLPTIYGPYKDRFARTSYSVFIPLMDAKGHVNALLGMDLDGYKVELQLYRVRLYILFIIMAFLVLLILGYAFLTVFSLKSLELEVQKNNLDKALAHLKETEAELARSEETFRGILNNSPNAIFGFDRDLKIIFWNFGAERLYGYKKDEIVNEKNPILSRRFTELFGIEDMEEKAEKVFSGATAISEIEHRARHGRVDVIMTLFPVKDPQEHILFGIGLIQDISEHKRFEEKLAAAHTQLKAIVDAATEVTIIATDLNGLITVFNTGAEKMFRVSADEVVGKKTTMQFHLESEVLAYGEELSKKFGRSVAGLDAVVFKAQQGSFDTHEWTGVRKDGTRLSALLTVTGLRNTRGELLGYLGVGFDLTSRKEAEKALLLSQQKYKDLVNSLNTGVYSNTPGPEGRFLEVNPAMLSMFEIDSEKEFLKHAVSETYQDRSKRLSFSEKITRQGYVKNEELELKTFKGRPFWASVTAVLKYDERGSAYFSGILQDITDRKTIELRLFEERDRLKTIADSIGAGLSLVNRDFQIVWINETLERWFGKTDTVQGKACYETYAYRHNLCEDCPTKRAFETGQLQAGDQRITFPNGNVRDFQLICTPIKNDKGEIEQILELTLDITEKNRTLELLEYERALSRNVIDSIGEELMVLDCHNRSIIDVNRKFLETSGLTKEAVIGKRCTDLGTHFCPPCEACDLDEAVEEGKVVESTHVHLSPSGEKVYVDVTLSPLRDEKGQVIGVIHLTRDVSDRKRLEDELRHYSESLESVVRERTLALQKSELMFRRLFESAQDGILIIDPENGKIIDVNPYALQLLECTQEQVQDIDYRNFTFAQDVKVFAHLLEELKHKMSAVKEEVVLKTCTAREITVEVRGSLYFVEEKKIVQFNMRDITERKRLEKIKTEFVSMVSHELRTPLSAIKEGVEIVADGTQGKLNRDQHECLGIALSNIKRLNRLIGDILDISKIQSNLLKVKLTPSDIYQVIDQVYSLVRIEIEKRGMVFVTDLEKNLPCVMADRDRLIQVLMNLLNNAVKFTREKSKITLLARKTSDFVEFAIKDEGAGIPPEELSRLFGKFVQLDSTLVRRVGGTGLGLYISRNFVEAMGGQIWAESKLGEGSVFKFTLPIQKGEL